MNPANWSDLAFAVTEDNHMAKLIDADNTVVYDEAAVDDVAVAYSQRPVAEEEFRLEELRWAQVMEAQLFHQ